MPLIDILPYYVKIKLYKYIGKGKDPLKKIICFILAFVLAFGAVPAEAMDFEKITEIKEDMLQQALYLIPEGFSDIDFLAPNTAYTEPETVTVEEASARLQDFIEKFEGKFFTADGNYCVSSGVHATSCENCLMSNVIASEWVENLVGMGTLNAALCPTQYSYKGTQGYSDGYQCFGFANFAHWYIFAQKNTDKVTSTLEATGPLTYETIKNALPGDVLRSNYYGGHSMIFISCDEEGFNVIDSNHTGNADGKSACIVKVHKVKYNSKYTVAITGVKNYDRTVECEHEYSEEVTPPTCTEQGYTTHTCTICGESYVDDYVEATGHSYENGVCTDCGKENVFGYPEINADLTHIICYGQSFSTGSDAPYYPDQTVPGVYVFGNIANSKNGTAPVPLSKETAGNQHPIISAGNSFAKMLAEAGINTDIILGSYGSGGKTIAQLMSSERQKEIKTEEGYEYDILSSGRYEVFEGSVAAIAKYAEEENKTVSCPAIVYLQGETDQNTDQQLGYPENPARAGYGAGGDKEKYKEYMCRLKEDMQAEVMEAYGQDTKPVFIIYQVSGTYVRTRYSTINMAQMEFAQENDDVILVQTPYFTSHYTNSHHLTVNGYRWLGEYIAEYMYNAFVEKEKTYPLMPGKIEITGENEIKIEITGAENGLEIDTWTVENSTNGNNLYGFNLYVDETLVKPAEIEISGNAVILKVNEKYDLLSAESVCVQYGGQKASGTGNIRDNSEKTGFYEYLDDSSDTGTGNNQGVSHSSLKKDGTSLIGEKYPLYNWLASFSYKISTGVQKQYVCYHWEMQNDELISITEDSAEENKLTLLSGSVKDGVLTGVQYSMEKTIALHCNRPWVIEWKAAGNGNSYGGGKFLSTSNNSSCAQYLYLPADSRGLVAWGVGSDSANYGFQLKNFGIDTRKEHIYRIENRIEDDGTNNVYLIVDGAEIGVMNTGYRTSSNASGSAGSLIEEPKNWIDGKNIYIDYIGGSGSFLLNNMKLSYLKVYECCHTYENGVCTGCGKSEFSLADLNLDGTVDVKDVYTARLVAAKLRTPTEQQILLGDVDLDGKITAIDANIIRKYILGIITKIPVE